MYYAKRWSSWRSCSSLRNDVWRACRLRACSCIGLSEGFRQPRGKPEGPQHFAFPEVSRETRGCLGAPFCFSRVSLGKLASFPESESWSGAKSGAKLRKSARYPGIFQVYRGFPGIPAKYPVFCRFWPQNSLRHGSEPPQNDEFHGVSPGPGVSRGN